ncbi:hypothetical protein Rrhod_0431 [Rhodococcus rhodnii LMG 5362]|uniref:Integral membrane protein n=1 Tax=Rhodococcus rhodnii LMG 5362 TaxID=1273125 RepID=R7WSH5_9NOCA|nr:hypothetical protein Rrhod_0431 [Rhodococcus rhodnii LMG 5362]
MGAHSANIARGGLMGVVETIPGVSAGTVALITNIYDRLILSAGHAVSGIRAVVTDVPRGAGTQRAREQARGIDWPLVAGVLAGMAVMVVISAAIVAPLVEAHPQRSYALFFGLVLASLWVPFSTSGGTWRPRDVALALAAAAAAFMLTGLPPSDVSDPAPLFVVGSAMIAICALVIPGLSGAFMLLALGMYTTTMDALNNREIGYILLFATGAFLGLSMFVKVLQKLLEEHRHITLVVMTGLLAGSLRALWPWQPWDGESRDLLAPSTDVAMTVGLMAAGVAIVVTALVVSARIESARAPQLQVAAAGTGTDEPVAPTAQETPDTTTAGTRAAPSRNDGTED